MPFKTIIIYITILISISNYCYSQPYHIQHFTTKQNLSSNTIHQITEDSIGRLWISSDNGLCEYNGINFITHTIKDGLPENTVLQLCNLNNNDLLFKTHNKGLYIKHFNTYTPVKFKNSTIEFQGIIANNKTIIALGKNKCILKFKRQNIFSVSKPIRCDVVNGLFINEDKAIICTTNGLYTMQVSDTVFSQFKRISNNTASAICQTKLFIYFNQNQKIYKLSKLNLSIIDSISIPLQYGLPLRITATETDIWVSTHTPKLLLKINLKTKHCTDLTKIIGLKNNLVTQIYIAKNNDIWLATNGNGLFHITDDFATYNPFTKTDSSLCVNSLFVTKNNDLMISSIGNFYVYKNQQLISQTQAKDEKNFNYYYGFSERKNELLVSQTINRKEKNSVNIGAISISRTTCFINDSEFVAGGWTLLLQKNKIKNGNIDSITSNKLSEKNERINKIIPYQNNSYLIATQVGLFIWDKHSNTSTQLFKTLLNENISDVIVYNNTIYLAVNNGYKTIKDNKLTLVTHLQQQALGEVKRFCINKKDGTLFIGSYNGLFILSRKGTYFLNETSPLHITEVSALAIDTSGTHLFVGSKTGFTDLNLPTFYTHYNTKTTCYIQSIKSFTTTYNYSQANKTIILQPSQQALSIEFSGLNFSGSQLFYQYTINNTPTVFLPFGLIQLDNIKDYETKITLKTSIDNINWSDPIKINIYKKPYFYTTWWFVTMIVIISIILVTLFFLWQISLLKNKNKKREQFIKEINLSKMKGINSSTNTHFISNFLVSIQNFISKNNIPQAVDYLALFSRHLRKVLEAVQQETHPLKMELQIVNEYISLQRVRFGEKIKVEVINDLTIDDMTLELPPLLLQPLLENCFSHAFISFENANNVISIVLKKKSNKQIVIQIKDNGIGYKEAKNAQSYGMQSVIQRMAMIDNASMKIENLNDLNKMQNGTLITLCFYRQ